MCEISDGKRCEVWVERIRHARKAHRCVVCASPIEPGEKYLFNSYVFDGYPGSDRLCLSCAEARDRFSEEHRYTPNAGYFVDALQTCVSEGAASQRKWGPTLRALERRRENAQRSAGATNG